MSAEGSLQENVGIFADALSTIGGMAAAGKKGGPLGVLAPKRAAGAGELVYGFTG